MWRILWMDENQKVNSGAWIKDFDLLASWVRYANRYYHLPHCIQAYNSIVTVPIDSLNSLTQT